MFSKVSSVSSLGRKLTNFSPRICQQARNEATLVGEVSKEEPRLTQYKKSKFVRARHPDPYQIEVNMTAEAKERSKRTAVVEVNLPGFSSWTLYCDENKPVGDDTAPPPLAYLSAGVGLCLMTHLSDILNARKIDVKSLKLEQRILFSTNLGHMRDHGCETKGKCDVVESHVIVESPESESRIRGLLEEAEGACMAHWAFRNPVPWSTRLVHNGKETANRSSSE